MRAVTRPFNVFSTARWPKKRAWRACPRWARSRAAARSSLAPALQWATCFDRSRPAIASLYTPTEEPERYACGFSAYVLSIAGRGMSACWCSISQALTPGGLGARSSRLPGRQSCKGSRSSPTAASSAASSTTSSRRPAPATSSGPARAPSRGARRPGQSRRPRWSPGRIAICRGLIRPSVTLPRPSLEQDKILRGGRKEGRDMLTGELRSQGDPLVAPASGVPRRALR